MKAISRCLKLLIVHIVWAVLPGRSDAALVLLRNTLDDGTGANAIASSAFAPFDNTDSVSSNNGAGWIGRMTISDASIVALWNAGNVGAIQAAFQPFGASFTLESTGFAGAFLDSRNADTRISQNSFGGSPIYFWAFKGASIAAAAEHLVAHLAGDFPTDPEIGPALSGNANLRFGEVQNLVIGGSGNFSFDYGGGSGALPGFNTVAVVPEPSCLMVIGAAFLMGHSRFRRRRDK